MRASVSAVRTHRFSRSPTAHSSSSPAGVAEPVVDLLEVVEIDEDQHESAVAHRLVEPLGEQQPVGQPGQRVVVDLMSESALCLVQPPVQQPLRAHGDHLSGGDEQDHHHRGADQIAFNS